jgi:hypothetical protein
MIFIQLKEQLEKLESLLTELTNEQYTHETPHLSNASIGSHTRHIIELLQCLLKGYKTNEVDYINRNRNLLLEQDKNEAGIALKKLIKEINLPDKELSFCSQELTVENMPKVYTTYFREIVYNTEHTIHHLALIKVALIEMDLQIVHSDFGMAYSTIRYKNSIKNIQ